MELKPVATYRSPQRVLLAALLGGAMALGLAGCGRKGPLEPHPADTQSRAAKSADGAVPSSRNISLGGGSRRLTSTPVRAPDRPFVLDALL